MVIRTVINSQPITTFLWFFWSQSYYESVNPSLNLSVPVCTNLFFTSLLQLSNFPLQDKQDATSLFHVFSIDCFLIALYIPFLQCFSYELHQARRLIVECVPSWNILQVGYLQINQLLQMPKSKRDWSQYCQVWDW